MENPIARAGRALILLVVFVGSVLAVPAFGQSAANQEGTEVRTSRPMSAEELENALERRQRELKDRHAKFRSRHQAMQSSTRDIPELPPDAHVPPRPDAPGGELSGTR